MIRQSAVRRQAELPSLVKVIDLSQPKLNTLKELFGVPDTTIAGGIVLTQGQRSNLYGVLTQSYFPFDQFDKPGAVKAAVVPQGTFEEGFIAVANTKDGLQAVITQSDVLPIQFNLSGKRQNSFPLLLSSVISVLCIPKELIVKAAEGQNIGIAVTQRGADFNSSLFYRLTLNDQSKDAAVLKLELVNNNAYERAAQDIVEEKMEIMEKSHSVFFISPSE